MARASMRIFLMRRWLRILRQVAVLGLWAAGMPWAQAAAEQDRYPSGHLLVDVAWLQARLGDSGLRAVDMRAPKAYASGHVPGAIHLPLEETRGTVEEIPFQMPPVSALEARLGRAGIAREHVVVAYDDQGGLLASRLFLALEYLGHERVHVLNGGFQAWAAAGARVTRAVQNHPPQTYRARPRPDLLASKADVLAGLGRPDRVLVDARSPAEFRGQDVRAARGGHIPGARNVEWIENIRQDPVPAWKSAQDLGMIYERAGVTPDKEVVTYCQTHLRSSHTYFTLRLLGFRHVKAYTGSWVEWGNDSALPVE